MRQHSNRISAEVRCWIPCPPDGPAPVPKTGQTEPYFTGDDGDYAKGVASPGPRFTDNGNFTVTDNLTGLMWRKNPTVAMTWEEALNHCNLLDVSGYDDWRLPNIREMQSLLDYGEYSPALPSGHPFLNVQSDIYWTVLPELIMGTLRLT